VRYGTAAPFYGVTAEGSAKGVMGRRIIPTMDVGDELPGEAELSRRSKRRVKAEGTNKGSSRKSGFEERGAR